MAYLDTIKAGAVSTWRTHQVLPSVVGAQAALESGWGTSKLAKPPYNNQFGIKASADWTGRTVNMPTREYISGAWITVNADFRAYDSAGDSVKDHGAFFTSTPWRENNYKDVVGETDYKKACWALQNAPAPYATDTGYAQKLINLIENNNLQAWDREALADNSNTVATQAQQTIVSKMVGADLTDAGKQYVRDLEVTMIGDSLGVGTKPYFESLVPKANYDVLGSRQITHGTNSLNGTYILQQMKNAGTLKEYVVVILGTNRGVTEQEVNNFASIAGDNHKVIFVDTASEVAHINTLSVYYQDAAKRLNNVYFANWRLKANSLKPQYYSKDGANGEYIHMTPLGYQKHAEFIAQALYEVATANFTDRVAEATKAEFYTIENFELNEGGLITYDAWRVNADGTSTKYKATKQTDIKGLYSPYGESNIYNPSANQQYGLGNSVNNSNWRETYFEDSEETDGLKLVEKASAELIERQEPEMIYTVNLLEIPVELSIGDTGIFVDHDFNPPLYIRARVLSITTSETNANLNKVTIGNVTELQPKDKSALMAIRAELQETRKELESSWLGSAPTQMTIVSTNGYILGDITRETSLVASVYKGNEDVTDQFDTFSWERISEDATKDAVFNTALSNSIQSSVLTVHEKDVIGNQSKFVARAFNATGEMISHQEIVIKRVETALWTDTDTAPAHAIDGATWTKPDGSQWVKVNGVWEEKVVQAVVFNVNEDIASAKSIADAAKAEADKANDSWAVKRLNGAGDIVSQINLSDDTFLIEAKHIVGIGDAVIDGKLTVTEDMIAGTISANKISGGTITGTTFSTTASDDDFTIELKNGSIDFKRAIFTMGTMNLTKNADTLQPNGFSINQRPGFMFNLSSTYNDGSTVSSPVLQIPIDSTGAEKKLAIYAQAGFALRTDIIDTFENYIDLKKPIVLKNGLRASHRYNSADFETAGNLMHTIDMAGDVIVHKLQIRKKDGNWVNSGFGIYEDGRVGYFKNNTWTMF